MLNHAHRHDVKLHQYPMRALRFHEFGIEHLRLEDVPVPQPRGDEVLVRVHAASITSADIKNVQGVFRDMTTLPRTPGRDFSGIIEQATPNCAGQEVWGTGGELGFARDGTHAEYVVVPSEAVVPKPQSISLRHAGSIGSALVTGWAALFDRAELKKGETVLVIGANGNVGYAAVQLGNWAGARVVGVDRTGENRSGADIMLSSSSGSFTDDLKKAVGSGVDVAFDTVSGTMFEIALNALRPGGRMVAITVPSDARISLDLLRFYRNDLRLFGLNTFRVDAKGSGMILRELIKPIEVGWIKPREANFCPFSTAVQAYRTAANSRQRCVLTMDE